MVASKKLYTFKQLKKQRQKLDFFRVTILSTTILLLIHPILSLLLHLFKVNRILKYIFAQQTFVLLFIIRT